MLVLVSNVWIVPGPVLVFHILLHLLSLFQLLLFLLEGCHVIQQLAPSHQPSQLAPRVCLRGALELKV